MTFSDNIKAVLKTCFSETRDENIEAAHKGILDIIKNDVGDLKWITPAEGRKSTFNKLYLALQPGYPLMIADWKTGHGYRDVRTGISIQPMLVAYINMPEIKYNEE